MRRFQGSRISASKLAEWFFFDVNVLVYFARTVLRKVKRGSISNKNSRLVLCVCTVTNIVFSDTLCNDVR